MKAPDCVKTPLMAAFRIYRKGSPKASGRPIDKALAPFDLWRMRERRAAAHAQLSALRKAGR